MPQFQRSEEAKRRPCNVNIQCSLGATGFQFCDIRAQVATDTEDVARAETAGTQDAGDYGALYTQSEGEKVNPMR